MASNIPLPRVISQRGRSSYEVERENFERSQTLSIQKAINQQETPVKEKHVRTTIIGSFHDKSGALFWSVVTKLPIQANPITAWKFLHVLHKLLREGHHNVILDSMKYGSLITELGKLWGHLKEGYGRLIALYCKLMLQKFAFHKKCPQIPGNLRLSEEDLLKITEHDVNSYFELSVDMLDYMDDILGLQLGVFGSLDMSRANSMTSSGQCRLAPLILCIQDSVRLYDYLVKLLFKLHSSLPPDTLAGHRERFYTGYKLLKQFYYSSSNLQYFKNLIQVPHLPENPPNFLVSSELGQHVTPVVVVPEPPDTPECETTDSLVDMTMPPEEMFGSNDFTNGSPSPPVPDERDTLIEQLLREINELKSRLSQLRAEDDRIINALRERIAKLERDLEELQQIAAQACEENVALKKEVEEASTHGEAVVKLVEAEKSAKANEERFKKMKDIYGKLREEHVKLLRTNAEVSKQLATEKQKQDEEGASSKGLEEELSRLREERSAMQESMQQSSSSVAEQLAIAASGKMALEDKCQSAENTKKEIEETLKKLQGELSTLQEQLSGANAEKLGTDEKLKGAEEARNQLAGDIARLEGELSGLKGQLEQSGKEKADLEALLRQQMADLQRKLLLSAVEEGEVIIQDSLDQYNNPTHQTIMCTAEYLLSRAEPVLKTVEELQKRCHDYSSDPTVLGDLVKVIGEFSHHLGDTVIQGKATSHSAPIEQGQELADTCKSSGECGLTLLGLIKNDKMADLPQVVEKLVALIKSIMTNAEELVPKVEDVSAEKIGDMVDQEMHATTEAIEAAAKRIQEMLESSREAQSGIQLEVNERILDSCTALMKAIKVLIERSKQLQKEIVADSRGTSSSKDFYKKHHRWTEGLISAAKAVGWGANVLVEAADKMVKGEGKFEELMVCSQEIAASTAQLVVASKVKAPRDSKNLPPLSEASKKVAEATAGVVASTKSGAELIEDQDTMDFSKLTLHQAKRLEMNSQVRVIELESLLEKERVRLAELRRKHYNLAGESEGWEVDEDGLQIDCVTTSESKA